jgi:hypothetical protein
MDGIASASLDSPSSSPNFALLVHNCLLACLASYNLRLSPLSLQGVLGEFTALDGAGLDAAKRTLQAVSEAASAVDTVAGAGVQGLAALAGSALDLVKDATTNTGEEQWQGTQAAEEQRQALVVEQARVERLVRLSVGASSSTDAPLRTDGITVQTIQSTKACAAVTYDPAQRLCLVAFRGTKDPIDVLTDISFLSAPFEPQVEP